MVSRFPFTSAQRVVCALAIFFVSSCAPDLQPSGPSSSRPIERQSGRVMHLRNAAVTGSLMSVVVHYRSTAPEDRLNQVMRPGVQVAYDIPRHASISMDVADSSTVATVAFLRMQPWVKGIEVNSPKLQPHGVLTRVFAPAAVRRSETVPWGVHAVQADVARLSYSFVGSGVKIGVIDSGIDCSVGDLTDRVVGGYDFVNDTAIACTPSPLTYHGTAVASIIAATPNGAGIVGVAGTPDIYNLRTMNSGGTNSYARVAAAIEWAIDHNLQVLNMSFGDCGMPTDTLPSNVTDAIGDATAAGIIMVASGGNGTAGPSFCPNADSVSNVAKQSGVIAVSAINQDSTIPTAYQHGPQITMTAPHAVYADSLGGMLMTFSGTSASAPHVTGAVAMMYQAGFGFYTVLSGLTSQTQIHQVSHSNTLGWGMLDVLAAVRPTPQFDSVTTDCETPLFGGPCHVQTYVKATLGVPSFQYHWQVSYSGGGLSDIDSLTGASSLTFDVATGPELSYSIDLYVTVSDSLSGRRRTSVGAGFGWFVCPTEAALHANIVTGAFAAATPKVFRRPNLLMVPPRTESICPT